MGAKAADGFCLKSYAQIAEARTIAFAPNGDLFVSSPSETTPGGEISTVGDAGALTTVAKNFRNPMYMRCHRTDEVCAAMELGEDLETGAVEKMLSLRPNTNYGYPCCQSMGRSAPSTPMPCSDITKEDASFPLSDTPFGFDWEPGLWPEPFKGGIFVALHGSFYSTPPWQKAGIVYAPADPTTHMPVQDWTPFQGGFAPGGTVLDRPADVAFSPDGRMFIADDVSGNIYWMAPTTLAAPGI
jgi:glucose/arabinose dehydrogenase